MQRSSSGNKAGSVATLDQEINELKLSIAKGREALEKQKGILTSIQRTLFELKLTKMENKLLAKMIEMAKL